MHTWVALLAGAFVSTPALADVLDFDDGATGQDIGLNYHGYDFFNDTVEFYAPPPSHLAPHSGGLLLLNNTRNGSAIRVQKHGGGTFAFIGAWLGSYDPITLSGTVVGSRGGMTVASVPFSGVNALSWTLITADEDPDWGDIDELRFETPQVLYIDDLELDIDGFPSCSGDPSTGDNDGDGVCDDLDACVGDDALGDSDSDGICDDGDLCVGDDSTGDTDLDGYCDLGDNCPETVNGDQDDADLDGVGDACDFRLSTDLQTCPGSGRWVIEGGTPFGQARVLFAPGGGSLEIPSGACAGTTTSLAPGARVAATVRLDGDGAFEGSPTLGSPRCGWHVQVIDMDTCSLTNVIGVP